MAAQTKVAAVVVNWNCQRWLAGCVSSLLMQSRPPDRLLIVDNGSTDDSIAQLAPLGTDVEIIRLGHNTGFAAANNTAIRMVSDCQWIALLNPDAVAEPDWLKHLLDAASANPGYASFATRMLCSDDPTKLDGAGDVYHCTGLAWRRGHGARAAGRYLHAEDVFSACAGAALYRRDALVEVGGFDERFFCYMEDVDLGFRLRLRAYPCLYVPAAIVHHVGSASTGKGSELSVYYGHRNAVWTFFKNMPAPLLLLLVIPHLLIDLYIVMRYAKHGQGRIALVAKRDAIKDLTRVFRQRKEVQRTRASSARSIARTLSYSLHRY